ncbi:ATP-binding protein [Amycolatopsis sp. cg5]|uniref:ATP-binding protein n=1 Tax=Amycolatopsis sp. cg5 TaxID=3238802 RepID=UPI003525975F
MTSLRQWVSGLRPRLVAAFAVITIVGAVAASGSMYLSARTTILVGVQDPGMEQLNDQVKAFLPVLEVPPTPTMLGTLAGRLKTNAVVVYQNQRYGSGPAIQELPDALRTQVASSDNNQFQRVVDSSGYAVVFLGIPVLQRNPDGKVEHTGIEVYARVPLTAQQTAIDELATRAWQTAALALPLAVALALLAARQVLRPVRALNTAARQLGHGKLDVRLEPKGSDELSELVSTFNTTASELERTVGELRAMEADARRFVADVSHELRTPLAAMNAVTDVLDEDAAHLPPDTAVAARLVSEETKRLTRLVQDLVEISRFDAGRAELLADEWDLATAIRDTLQARGWRSDTDLVLDLPEGITAWVDRRRLDLIVANLVGNALRHGRPPVEIALRGDEREVRIEVTDHGPGIEESMLPHVFDRFTKADSSRARSEGSGLGLAIAQENAKLHGGVIVPSNTGTGARFVLRLPRRHG